MWGRSTLAAGREYGETGRLEIHAIVLIGPSGFLGAIPLTCHFGVTSEMSGERVGKSCILLELYW
jgi:hypothetical protein